MLSSTPILVINREPLYREMLAARISRFGTRPVCCGTLEDAAEEFARHSFSIVFCDEVLPDGTFQSVMKCAEGCGKPPLVIVTSRQDDWDLFLKALNAGAFDYVALPPLPGEMERILSAALRESAVAPIAVAHRSQESAAQSVA